jgi:hypothetical protein
VTTPVDDELIPLTEGAHRLAIRYGLAFNWLLTGRLEGEKRHGRWMVTAASVERIRRERDPVPAA